MSSSVRDGRRRRLLHEGAGTSTAAPTGDDQPAEKVRYTPRDGSASFAVASGVAPRSPLAIFGAGVGMIAAVAGLAWADTIGQSIGQTEAGLATARLLRIDQPGSLAAWWEACLWLAVAGQSLLLFGVRRQRTDDTSGAYRWWLAVALLALGMSLNSATEAHAVVAAQLASLTGFSPLTGHAFWWLVPSCLVLGGVAVRSLLEIRESPVAAALGTTGVVLAGVGYVLASGLVPTAVVSLVSPAIGGLLAPVAATLAVSFGFLSLLAYSSRIVREAAGEVAAPVVAPKAEKAAAKVAEKKLAASSKPAIKDVEEAEEEPAPKTTKRPQRQRANLKVAETDYEEDLAEPEIVPTRKRKKAAKAEASEDSRWVTGGEDYEESYDDDDQPRRKLTKAQRKALRREKARRAA